MMFPGIAHPFRRATPDVPDVQVVYENGNPDHTPARALDIDDTGGTFHEAHWCQPGDIFHEAAERLFTLHTR